MCPSGHKQEDAKPFEPPKADATDTVHALAKAGISLIPVIGGAGVELFSALVHAPLEQRRNEWMAEVGDALRNLAEAHGTPLEGLQDNDAFLDTVLSATLIAIRTSQKEKREALRNAVLNSALPTAPDQSLQQFFLYLVDIFTVWHIRIMGLFQDPPAWAAARNHAFPNLYSAGLSAILESAFPELAGKRSFYDQVWQDVNTHGLTRTPSLHSAMTSHGLMEKRLSELGVEFMEFVRAP